MDVLDNNGLDTQIAFIKAYVDKQIKAHASIPVGYEYFSMNPNVPQGSLPLLGGLYDRATYPDLWDWVQEQTGYCKTEQEWQTLSAAQNGNVPFYSSGDGSTTFRVPSLKCWIKGANGIVSEVGSYLEAGLPNITGGTDGPQLRGNTYGDGNTVAHSGAFHLQGSEIMLSIAGWQPTGVTDRVSVYTFDASRSSSIYGNANTVQPESIVGLWLVKAYGNIEDTGTINEQQYIDDKFAQSRAYADSKIITGTVQAYAGNMLPNGWLLCDGSAINRADYADLFNAIGVIYGAGDGSTTFNLPNMNGRVAIGSGIGTDVNSTSKTFTLGDSNGEYTHQLTINEMPAHKHTFNSWYGANGANGHPCGIADGTYGSSTMDMNNTGGDAYHNNIQPYTVLRYIIKY